jgi:hypothetical protein
MCAREEERRIAPQKSLRCVGSTPLYLGHFVYQFHLTNTRRIKRALLIIRTYSLAAVRAAFRASVGMVSLSRVCDLYTREDMLHQNLWTYHSDPLVSIRTL